VSCHSSAWPPLRREALGGVITSSRGWSLSSPARSFGFLLLVLVSAARAQQPESQFTSPGCHVGFAYPKGWEVVPDTTLDPDDPCAFAVRPRDWQQRAAAQDSVDLYGISVQIVPRGVWSEVSESAFRKRGTGWVVLGRQDLEDRADTISGPGWSGVRGLATEGCDRMDGSYAGLCSQPTAVVGTSTRSIMLSGGPQSEDTFNRILASLRFR
jgi:hypothetical protein